MEFDINKVKTDIEAAKEIIVCDSGISAKPFADGFEGECFRFSSAVIKRYRLNTLPSSAQLEEMARLTQKAFNAGINVVPVLDMLNIKKYIKISAQHKRASVTRFAFMPFIEGSTLKSTIKNCGDVLIKLLDIGVSGLAKFYRDYIELRKFRLITDDFHCENLIIHNTKTDKSITMLDTEVFMPGVKAQTTEQLCINAVNLLTKELRTNVKMAMARGDNKSCGGSLPKMFNEYIANSQAAILKIDGSLPAIKSTN